MRLALLLLALAATLPGAPRAESLVDGDPASGEQLYSTACIACHGTGGNSSVPAQPILSGQDAEYLVGQITAEDLRVLQ